MGNLLRVLVIEDSEDDAALVVRELRRGGYEVAFERVDTAAAVSAALGSKQWDVILSDYTLPGFNAPAALKLVQERGLDIPFIIVSGTVGEDVAVAAMKAGAHDFFPKQNVVRLVAALERELHEAEQRRKRGEMEKQLHQAEERFAKAFHSSPVGIAVSTADGRFLDMNDYALRMLGFRRAEVIDMTSQELGIWGNPEDRFRVGQLLREHKSVRDLELQFRTKSGETRDVQASFEIIKLGDEDCVLTLAHDITERKQAEFELKALYNASSYLFKADHLLSLGHQIVEAVVNEFKQAACGLLLIDGSGNHLVRLAHSGAYPLQIETPLDLDGRSLVAEAARAGNIVHTPGAAVDARHTAPEERTRAELVVPLKTIKGVLGVLDLHGLDHDAFSERDRRILSTFAERAAAALEIMQLYEEINRHAAELEWRVAQRTAELAALNQELEAFNYSVSHDLRSPLWAIDGLSRVLLQDFAGRLGTDAAVSLARIREAARQMADMIDGLLQLSRLTRAELEHDEVDLSTLAYDVAEELKRTQPAREVQFSIQEGLMVPGDRRLLRMVLANLLGNAWKFTSKTPQSRIEFGETRANGGRAYFVRDNGVGFDPNYADQLFVVFQRLHSDAEFEGTGIGLATVQRILHRHGGKIWAEGAVNQGATFYFTTSRTAEESDEC